MKVLWGVNVRDVLVISAHTCVLKMTRKLVKFLILFDNTNLLYFPGQFLSGRVLVELKDDTPALGKQLLLYCQIKFET